MTNVIAINGSPKMEKGNTVKILKPFLEGMETAGASVELFYAKRLNVRPCDGELYCWTKKPGQCYIDDSMQSLYPKLRDADIIVLATPVYIPLPGEMQNLLNRLVPLMEPTLKWRNGRTRLSGFRADVKISKFVLVSTSGWWEMGNFGTVLRIVKELANDLNVEFAGALLRPNFYYMSENKEKAEKIFEAAKQAGTQLIKEGRMSKDLLEVICQPLISQEKWRREL
ncbi:MAG: flavodoxin family protein [Methanomassiliicoccales archaeon]|nr:flavodoxin family protein [Methanomassiliicoccales archaeon]